MSTRLIVTGGIALALLALAAPAPAQEADRTAWGAPDLQGVWDFRTITPLERPEELGDKAVLTAEEAAEYERESLARQDKDRRADDVGANRDVANAYNQFWWDYGDSLTEDRRTSLVVYPPNGRIPRKPRERGGNAAFAAMARTPAGPEDRPLWERCILGFNSGPPMLPSAYNNNVQILQTPDTVVIFNEMVHNARIVPLDGRTHLPAEIRLVTGDARGRWEGSTLVVETRNFESATGFTGAGAETRLIERFERIDADTLHYEFTIDDPDNFTEPWTALIPMTKNDSPLFEYACHEGNYGMTNLLLGARADDAAAAR